jgi:predicted ATPase/class 3 adenylate cyclase
MSEFRALLLTDVVDSTKLARQLGDVAIAEVWARHDRLARDLLPARRGREIDKTDGMLMMFETAAEAVDFALTYQHALAGMEPPLQARVGVHVGLVTLRENPAADVALGAKPIEVEGAAKATAARVMSTALGGQILLSAATLRALGEAHDLRLQSHGHWRLKGLDDPIELFEVADSQRSFASPPDADKAYRVTRQGDLWLPVREIRHSLPAERDAFVGRAPALAELSRQVQAGARLVCVLGLGGTGKTRLVTRFGWSWLGDFPGGVWFCDLAAARGVDGIVYAVAQGLDVPLGSGDPVTQLGHAIAGRGPCLVILDNFEQVSRHAAATLGPWLDRAPKASFVVTTREVLGLAGERVLALPPLPMPEGESLFRQRAEAAAPGARAAPEDQVAISTLVELLDGLPLAIELAAARVRVMSPRVLLQRMNERFKLLSAKGNRIDRQATMRATLDWSWDLLPPAERAALAQLSVFEGGFNLEAAEAVLDFTGLADTPWALDAVSALVDKSLVRARANDRFDLLVTVQVYAAEHLQTEGRYAGSGPQALAAAQRRHADWFASLGPTRATEGNCADLDNLVAACRRAVEMGDGDLAAGTLEGAWAGLDWRGPYQVGVDLAEAVCAMPQLTNRTTVPVRLVLSSALRQCGRSEAARPHCEHALVAARAAGDPRLVARATLSIADVVYRLNLVSEARDLYAEAIQMAHDLGERAWECGGMTGLGSLEQVAGRFLESREHLEQGLVLAREIGNLRAVSGALCMLGGTLSALGQMDAGIACLKQALEMGRELGHRRLQSDALGNLGFTLYLHGGRMEEAEVACLEALQIVREVGQAQKQGVSLHNLALVREALWRPEEARADFEAAIAIYRSARSPLNLGECLGHLGLLHARQGRHAQALVCLDEGEAQLRALSDQWLLGILLCGRAEALHWAGDAAASSAAIASAAALAVETNAAAESELGAALSRTLALVGAG